MRHHNEKGVSGVIILIFVLFLALMATLGVVFYQNFVAKKPSVPVQTTSSPQSSALQTARVAFNSTIYAMDYPSGWTVVPTTSSSSSSLAVTNGDGTIRVNLTISPTPVTGSCDSSDGLQIHDYSVDTTNTVKGLTATQLYLVEAIYDATGGGYQYAIGLVPYGGDTNASLNTSHCTVSHVGVAAGVLMNGQTIVHPTVLANIAFPKLPLAPKAAAPDMQTLKNLLQTNDYTAAVKIIESARKE